MLWRKSFLGKERVCGVVTIPLKDLKKVKAGQEPPPADWYPVLRPQEKVLNTGGDIVLSAPKPEDEEEKKEAKEADKTAGSSSSSSSSSPATSPEPEQEDESDEEDEKKSKKVAKEAKKVAKAAKKKAKKDKKIPKTKKPGDKVGQIRMQIYICTPFVEKVVLPGIAYDGEWHDRMNGGNIVGNPFWAENPQYLLTVGCSTRVTITLAQPRDHNTQATFYVLRYDDSKFAGRRITYFAKEDIVHVDDTEFLAPSFAVRGLYLSLQPLLSAPTHHSTCALCVFLAQQWSRPTTSRQACTVSSRVSPSSTPSL